MTKVDDTYQNSKVYMPQGADKLAIDSDGSFDFYGDSLSGTQLKSLLYSPTQFSVIANSAGVLSVINLPSEGYIFFSIADAASNASAWFTSLTGQPGQVLYLVMRGVGSTGSVYISTSGVSIVGTISGDLSSISIQNSGIYRVGASTGVALLSGFGYLKLLCTASDEWSVLEKAGGVVERGSA